MLLLAMSSCILWCVHFLLLGAVTGAFMNFIGACRALTFQNVEPTKRNIWVLFIFIGLLTGATALTWQGMVSLLPLAGSTANIIAYWHKKPKFIRRFALVASPPWFIYDVLSGSYPGMAVEIFKVCSNLIGQYRFDLKRSTRRKLLRAFKPA